jgi:predicted Zn-dependent peptidase
MNLKKILIAMLLTAAFYGASFAQDAAATATPAAKQKPPAGGTPKPFTLPKKEVVTLKNGIQVTLIPYGAIPKVTVRADVRAGNLNEAENQIWLADLTGSLLKEGTATRSAAQIAEEAARMGGSVDVGVGADTTSVTGDVLSEFGPQLVALMGEVMTRPLLPAAELARLKNDQLRQLSIARSQPGPLANELFRKTLYPNHPYGRLYPTEEMVKSYTIEDVQKFYRENFSAARTRIYVAGQFDAAAMKKALAGAFESWPRGAEAVINVPKPTAARALRLVDRPNAQQSTLYIGLPAIDPSNADYIPFLVTNSLLGGSFGSRITSNIREQKGYT